MCTCRAQGFGARIERRPGGHHIVHKHQALANDVGQWFYCEGSDHVRVALFKIETDLLICSPRANEALAYWDAEQSAELSSQEIGLVIAATSLSRRIQRRGHKGIECRKAKRRSGHCPNQARDPRGFIFILYQVNGAPNPTTIGRRRAGHSDVRTE